MPTYRLITGDCRVKLKPLAGCSADSIVTDPPYELGFMGKGWDRSGIAYNVEVWRECLRVLKPGGYLLAFGGSRTYHRLACAIEDAGFEIRDQIQWIYGSGFPKSLDVSKAIDAAAGADREIVGANPFNARRPNPPVSELHQQAGWPSNITAPATDAAKQWNGWGTALKPAHEPIVLARKPLIGTVAENVLQHGTGGLNIDGCRIGTSKDVPWGALPKDRSGHGIYGSFESHEGGNGQDPNVGRWPANVIHDGTEEVLAVFPDAPGQLRAVNGNENSVPGYSGGYGRSPFSAPRLDFGSASRFFYCAKASKEDREEGLKSLPHRSAGAVTDRKDGSDGLNSPRAGAGRTNGSRNHHPTVKPTDLMRYLCRLVTPPNGIVLDPFCGSGSTGKAAILEGLNFIGIELSAEYCELAEKRIEAVTRQGLLLFEATA